MSHNLYIGAKFNPAFNQLRVHFHVEMTIICRRYTEETLISTWGRAGKVKSRDSPCHRSFKDGKTARKAVRYLKIVKSRKHGVT